MSYFAATIEEIGTITPIKDADMIVCASLKGIDYSFVVKKGQFQVGENVIYLPVDSLCNEKLLNILNLTGKLAGSGKNRIKTIKLRSVPSQGIVMSINQFEDNYVPINGLTNEKITEILGITKWEPDPEVTNDAITYPFQKYGFKKYDIESSQRYQPVVDYLMDIKVIIQEKIEGQFASISFKDGEIIVTSRNLVLHEKEGIPNKFWETCRRLNFIDKVKQFTTEFNSNNVTIKFEQTGQTIQGNIYKLNCITGFVFDIQVDERYLDAQEFLDVCEKYNIQTVPVLAKDITLREYLNGKTIAEVADGESKLFKTAREGIVIRPMINTFSQELSGRTILKFRGLNYLSKEK